MTVLARESINTERLLQTFLEMVRIDSPSGEEEQMRAYLEAKVQALDLCWQSDAGGNLIVEVPAENCQHEVVLVLSGHMDVVPPCHNIQPIVEEVDGDCFITSDNTTVLGADDKSGLAPILEAVTLSLEHKTTRPKLRLIFTTREETYLGGAKEVADEHLQAGFSVILDHTGKQGTIINKAPTYIEFQIECLGKSVHAGIMPEQGVNAIAFAAQVIEQLHLGRLDAETTANIGFWDGGKATNIVPDLSVIKGELRGHNPERLQAELVHIEQVLKTVSERLPGTEYRFKHQVEFHGFEIAESQVGVQRVIEAAKASGLEPNLITTNGGSDNNVFVHRGLPGVVLSAGYMEPHSLKERVRLSEMRTCTQFLLNMFEAFARERF